MEFNPTNDYYGLDFSKEENVILWNFWEFIKNLVTISCTSTIQKEVIGIGNITNEIVDDFDTYYTLQKNSYLKNELLAIERISELNLIDNYFKERISEKFVNFWDDKQLEIHPDWKEVRNMAKRVLEKMNYGNLRIEIVNSSEEVKSKKGEILIIESIKTYLKNKNIS